LCVPFPPFALSFLSCFPRSLAKGTRPLRSLATTLPPESWLVGLRGFPPAFMSPNSLGQIFFCSYGPTFAHLPRIRAEGSACCFGNYSRTWSDLTPFRLAIFPPSPLPSLFLFCDPRDGVSCVGFLFNCCGVHRIIQSFGDPVQSIRSVFLVSQRFLFAISSPCFSRHSLFLDAYLDLSLCIAVLVPGVPTSCFSRCTPLQCRAVFPNSCTSTRLFSFFSPALPFPFFILRIRYSLSPHQSRGIHLKYLSNSARISCILVPPNS